MDTKLKRYNKWLKVTAFIGTIVFAVLATLLLLQIDNENYSFNYFSDINKKDYTKTNAFINDRWEINNKIGIILRYESESFSEDVIAQKREELKRDFFDQVKEDVARDYLKEKGLLQEVDVAGIPAIEVILKENGLLQKYLNEGISFESAYDDLLWDFFEKNYKTSFDSYIQGVEQSEKMMLKDAQNALSKHTGLVYYVEHGDGSVFSNYSNINEILDKFRYAYRYEPEYFPYQEESSWNELAKKSVFAFTDDYIAQKNEQLATFKDKLLLESVYLLGILVCLAYLIYAAGKKATEPKSIHLLTIDRLFNEFTIALLSLSGIGAFGCAAVIYEKLFFKNFMILLLALSYALFVGLLLMLVRHLKNRTLIKNTLLYRWCAKLGSAFRKVYSLGSPMTKIFVAITGLGLLTMIPFVGFVTLPLAMWITYRQMKKFIQLKDGIQMIRNGSYEHTIDIAGDGELAQVAGNVNEIASGLGQEVENRLKSERMKTELIVNVSHDIRTPLTSLVTYVDLLKKETMGTEEAEQYLDVIAAKTDRLRGLIDDLFEAAKAASGNINVTLEKVELESLITQGLGELDDKIKASELDFRIQMPKQKVYVNADGKLLWRVIENLLSNVLKYSLRNSRVYIDIMDDEKNAIVEIKNISAEALNIPEDEIVERFKRGDLSRSSEGSGLGLDIAKSLMICQGGTLEIKIDGDLFKAKVSIEKFRGAHVE